MRNPSLPATYTENLGSNPWACLWISRPAPYTSLWSRVRAPICMWSQEDIVLKPNQPTISNNLHDRPEHHFAHHSLLSLQMKIAYQLSIIMTIYFDLFDVYERSQKISINEKQTLQNHNPQRSYLDESNALYLSWKILTLRSAGNQNAPSEKRDSSEYHSRQTKSKYYLS